MKKKICIRCFIGAPIGLVITIIISIFSSLAIGDGQYYPIVPELADICGNELNAVIVQLLCAALYGAVWGGSSLIWDLDRWSLLRQTLTHLMVSAISTLPIAYFLHWMEHSISGFLIYFSIFFVIYASIWLTQYCAIRKSIQQINEKLNDEKIN